jgi:hypothetical protein
MSDAKSNVVKSVTPKGTEKPPKLPRTNEEKAEKFKELARARVGRALKVIVHIGNLSSTNYVHTPEQAAKIVSALKGAVAQLENRFSQPPKSEKPSFDL